MAKRFIKTFLSLAALTFFYLLTLTPLILLSSGLDTATYLLTLFCWFFLVLISLFPTLSMIIRSIWFFSGNGKTISEEELKKKILLINKKNNHPFHVKERKKNLTISWNYKDKAWCSYMQKEEINRLYELKVSFDAPTKTVFLSDRVRYLELFICPDEIKRGIIPRFRPYLNISLGKKNTPLNALAEKPAHEFSFLPKELKAPVMISILESGWNVRYSLF